MKRAGDVFTGASFVLCVGISVAMKNWYAAGAWCTCIAWWALFLRQRKWADTWRERAFAALASSADSVKLAKKATDTLMGEASERSH